MNRPPAARLLAAALVLATAWGLSAASVVIAWLFQLPAAPVEGTFLSPAPPSAQARFDDIGVTVAGVYAPLAAVLILYRPQPIAVLLAGHAIGSGLAAFGVQYGLLAAAHPQLPWGGFLAYAGGWGFVPGTFLTAVIPVFLIPRATRFLRRGLVPLVVLTAAVATLASMTHQGEGQPRNPLAPDWPAFQAVLPDVYGVAAAVTLLASVVVAGAVAARAARAGRGQRVPLVWLLIGHLFLTASYVVTVLPASLQLAAPVWAFSTIAPIVGQMFYPSAILVMGLAHRLRGIDVAVSAVLTTSIVAVLAVGAYFLIVTAPGYPGLDSTAATLVTAAVIAAAQFPARRFIRKRVDRLVHGEAGGPERLVTALGSNASEIATGADGVQALAVTLRDALSLGSVRITAADAGAPEAAAGTPRGPVTTFPLDQRGSTVLAVTGSLEDAPLGGFTRRLIAELAPVLGAVVRLAAASTELDAARERAAVARHAERRMLRRELHDGLGPALSGAGFSIAAAANLLARGERREAAEAVARVEELLDAQAVNLAGLAAGGITPLGGLSEALEGLVASFADAGTEVRLDRVGEVRLDPARAGMLHRIASEAVLNAVRHSGASSIVIALGRGDELLSVRDDGCGIPEHRRSGVGLSSMREWAEGAGWRCLLTQPEGGGTLVTVRAEHGARDPFP